MAESGTDSLSGKFCLLYASFLQHCMPCRNKRRRYRRLCHHRAQIEGAAAFCCVTKEICVLPVSICPNAFAWLSAFSLTPFAVAAKPCICTLSRSATFSILHSLFTFLVCLPYTLSLRRKNPTSQKISFFLTFPLSDF